MRTHRRIAPRKRHVRWPQAAHRSGDSGAPQRTLASSLVIGGQGLHSGLKTGVILHPAPRRVGIVFSSLADQSAMAARLENVTETGYNTTLSAGGHSVRTVEHLMSALHGLGVTNLIVKTDDEVPALDGSAVGILPADRRGGPARAGGVGRANQRNARRSRSAQGDEFIRDRARRPSDHRLHAGLSGADWRPAGPFRADLARGLHREVAPARTFGFVREFHKLAEMGLASGGRLDNLILVDDEKVVNTTLRFPDEFARHKVLDMIGDLYLLGRPIYGHVTAAKTGHSDNLALLRAIAARCSSHARPAAQPDVTPDEHSMNRTRSRW